MRPNTPASRRYIRVVPILTLAGALLLPAAMATAKPVIAGFAVTPEREHSRCGGRTTCLRVTLRVFDGSRLEGSILRFRFVARHMDEKGLGVNMLGEMPNRPGVHRMWLAPARSLRRGTYLARVIVTGASTTKSPVRSFVWR